MHMPWNAYLGIPNYNLWFWYNPWLPYYDYQSHTYVLPMGQDLNNWPRWRVKISIIDHAKQYEAEIVCSS
jgi:hypothetical protein